MYFKFYKIKIYLKVEEISFDKITLHGMSVKKKKYIRLLN